MTRHMSPEVFTAECDAIIDQAMPLVHGMLSDSPRDVVVAMLARLVFSHIDPGRLVSVAASALVRLADEQAYAAKTESNFEDYAETTAETLADLRAELAAVREQLAAVTA